MGVQDSLIPNCNITVWCPLCDAIVCYRHHHTWAFDGNTLIWGQNLIIWAQFYHRFCTKTSGAMWRPWHDDITWWHHIRNFISQWRCPSSFLLPASAIITSGNPPTKWLKTSKVQFLSYHFCPMDMSRSYLGIYRGGKATVNQNFKIRMVSDVKLKGRHIWPLTTAWTITSPEFYLLANRSPPMHRKLLFKLAS